MKKKVLFLCTGNSCRSQMAEGLLNYIKSSEYQAFSAGTKPTEVNTYSIKVMSELGIDISKQKSQYVDEFKGDNFDLVITVCDKAKESCPLYSKQTKLIHWSFKDPADATGSKEEILDEFRKIRDEIKEKLVSNL